MRFAILQCDHVANELLPFHNDYPAMFEQLFSNFDFTTCFLPIRIPLLLFTTKPFAAIPILLASAIHTNVSITIAVDNDLALAFRSRAPSFPFPPFFRIWSCSCFPLSSSLFRPLLIRSRFISNILQIWPCSCFRLSSSLLFRPLLIRVRSIPNILFRSVRISFVVSFRPEHSFISINRELRSIANPFEPLPLSDFIIWRILDFIKVLRSMLEGSIRTYQSCCYSQDKPS